MLHLFPTDRAGWLRAALFPFQAFRVTAYFFFLYSGARWPGRYWDKTDLKLLLIAGDVTCLVVLVLVGLVQLSTWHRRCACINSALAGFTALLCWPMLNFVQT